MKYILASILLILACKGIQAQNLTPADVNSSVIESAIILPKQDNKALLTKELMSQSPGRPITFAKSLTSNFSVDNAGVWDTSRADIDVWKLMIESKGALSINLGFTSFFLPEDAEMYLYDIEQSSLLGPFTADDNDIHGQFWTPIIKGDALVIELRIPSSKKEELILELTQINHDFMGFGNASGSCNLDVICGEEDGFDLVEQYRDIIQSVGAYHINGTETCTGALINNAREDKTPYFLTADHCGINPNNQASVVAYWNYENSYCRQPDSPESGQNGDGNLTQFNSGAIFRASSGTTDFCLIEFDDPIKPEYKPFFSGWNNAFVSSPELIGIHHPGVEEKRISFEFDQVDNNGENYIEVPDWDLGTTEGGSSGSPLYNSDKHIIGQLYGGLAACSNDLYDDYGSFGVSWLGLGSPETSLKPWLDPDDLGLTELDGYNGSYGIQLANNNQKICTKDINEITLDFEVEATFIDFVNIEIQNLPAGLTVASIDENITPGSTGQITIQNLSNIPSGIYEIIIVSTDGENIGENTLTLSLSDDNPEKAITISPDDLLDDAQVTQEFIWMPIDNAVSYNFQLSYNNDFTDIFTSVNDIKETKYTVQNLGNLTQYYWRVRASNHCGEGDWSDPFSFTTSVSYCVMVSATDVPISISESGTSVNVSSLFFDHPIIVDDIKISNVTIQHSYLEDLDIILSNPENDEQVLLMNAQCGSNENINAGFADDGSEQMPCPPIDGMVYTPRTPFRNLVGINAQGKWDLNVNDTYNFDGGQLLEWTMEICFSTTEEPALIPLIPDGTVFCEGEEITIPFYYNQDEETQFLVVETASGTGIPHLVYNSTPTFNGSGEFDLNIIDNDTNPLVPGLNEIYIKWMGTNIETNISIFIESYPEISSIDGLTIGETIEDLQQINWTGSNADSYTIYIAQDNEFVDIIWTETVDGDISSIEGPELDDGEYFIVIEATNECGTISSELYNFMIDESVSVIESNTPTLIVGQNISNQTIILSGNSAHIDLEMSIISVSGHKLLTQNFHEETLHVDVSALIPGVYFMQIKSGIDRTIRKIVIY